MADAPAPAPSTPLTDIDRLILGVVQGHDPERVARAMGLDEVRIHPAVAEARRRLTIAADYNRDEQLGTAIKRLNDCYCRAMSVNELRIAVQSQKELNRIMDLYGAVAQSAATSDGEPDPQLTAVRGHLAPLGLGNESTSTEELARLAVAEIVKLRHGR
jgi:hypothetical protein